MKTTTTKERARKALYYIVGYLTDNATMRKVESRMVICKGMTPDDAADAVAVLNALLKKELARNVGCNRNPIYISTAGMNRNKLKSDDAITEAVNGIWDEVEKQYPIALKTVTAWGKIDDDEDDGDEVPEELTEAEIKQTVSKERKSVPKERKSVPEKPKSVPEMETEEVPKGNPSVFIRDFISEYAKKLAEINPEILVNALRNAGWEVTAKKIIVTEL